MAHLPIDIGKGEKILLYELRGIELRGSRCIHSAKFHNCSGPPVQLVILEAVASLLHHHITPIQLCISCLVIKLFHWVIKGKLKQDLFNKAFMFCIFQGQIPSRLTLEPCTVFCRTVVNVSLQGKSWPLLDNFAFCESLRECFSLGDSPQIHYSSFVHFL